MLNYNTIRPALVDVVYDFFRNPSEDKLLSLLEYDSDIKDAYSEQISSYGVHSDDVFDAFLISESMRIAIKTVLSNDDVDEFYSLFDNYVSHLLRANRNFYLTELISNMDKNDSARNATFFQIMDFYPSQKKEINDYIATLDHTANENDVIDKIIRILDNTRLGGNHNLLPIIKHVYGFLLEHKKIDKHYNDLMANVTGDLSSLDSLIDKDVDSMAEDSLSNNNNVLSQEEISYILNSSHYQYQYCNEDMISNVKKFNHAIITWLENNKTSCVTPTTDILYEVVVLLDDSANIVDVITQESKFCFNKILLSKSDSESAKAFIKTLVAMGYFS